MAPCDLFNFIVKPYLVSANKIDEGSLDEVYAVAYSIQ